MSDQFKSGRGGDRGGRRPKGVNTKTSTFELKPRHLEKIAAWEEARGCKSASEALRQIIDAAPEPAV